MTEALMDGEAVESAAPAAHRLKVEVDYRAEICCALSYNGVGFSRSISNTTDSAEAIATQLRGAGLSAQSHHSKLKAPERRQVLDEFRSGRISVLATPMTLDEGIDVPEADLAVVLAASKQRRQMTQRLGRVVRPKADGRPARFVMVHVNNTSEDPAHGAHEAFLDDLTEVAESLEVMRFDECSSEDLLAALEW